LQRFGRDSKWLGDEIGITIVLHTWGQNLSQHLHVHCVVSGGALAPDGRWIPAKRGFFFPVRALSVVFRIAIGNERPLGCENGEVRFRYQHYAHANKTKVMRLAIEEFIRRFLLHMLPKGLMRIGHYGLLANRHRTEHLAACRVALDAPTPAPAEPETVEAFLSRVLGAAVNRCPHYGQGSCARSERCPPPAHPSAMAA